MAYARLERTSRQDNTLKYYEVEVSRDALGDWVSERRWGRIGNQDNSKRNGFASEADALADAVGYIREKLGRGYHVVADPDGLAPADAVRPDDWHGRILRTADELDRLVAALPTRDSRFGRIVQSLATACRQRRQAARPPTLPSQRAAFALDDTDYRIRARIFQLLDELVSGVMDDDGVSATVRHIQDASNPGLAGAAVRLVPRTQQGALDRRVDEICLGDPSLDATATALRDRNIIYVGDLVQAPFSDVLRGVGGDRQALTRLEDRLSGLGLRLGARAPGWVRPAMTAVAGMRRDPRRRS